MAWQFSEEDKISLRGSLPNGFRLAQFDGGSRRVIVEFIPFDLPDPSAVGILKIHWKGSRALEQVQVLDFLRVWMREMLVSYANVKSAADPSLVGDHLIPRFTERPAQIVRELGLEGELEAEFEVLSEIPTDWYEFEGPL